MPSRSRGPVGRGRARAANAGGPPAPSGGLVKVGARVQGRRVGAGGGGEYQHHAEQHRPHRRPVWPKAGALIAPLRPSARGRPIRDIPLGSAATDGDRATLRPRVPRHGGARFGSRPRRGWTGFGSRPWRESIVVDAACSHTLLVAAAAFPGHSYDSSRHVIVLFLVLAGLADGLAPKERRYA